MASTLLKETQLAILAQVGSCALTPMEQALLLALRGASRL